MKSTRTLTWMGSAGVCACILFLAGPHWPVYLPLLLVYTRARPNLVLWAAGSVVAGIAAAALIRPGFGTAALALEIVVALHALGVVAFALRRSFRSADHAAMPQGMLSAYRSTLLLAGCFYLALATVREFGLSATLSAAVLAFVTWYQVRDPAARISARALAASTVRTIVAVAILLVVLEVGARIFIPQPLATTGMYRGHPEFFYDLAPNTTSRLPVPVAQGMEYVDATISGQGLRDREYGPKQPGETRIVLVGDSFTFGQTVAADETISAHLERALGESAPGRTVTVINFGVPATGPWQQLGLYLERGQFLDADIIVHQLFLGNDLHDALAEVGKTPRAVNEAWRTQLAYWQFQDRLRFTWENALARRSHAYYAMRRAIGRKHILQFLAHDVRVLPEVDFPDFRGEVNRPSGWEANLVGTYPELHEGFDRIVGTLREFEALCDANGIHYATYCVPQIEEVSPRHYAERIAPLEPTAEYEPLRGIRILEDRLEDAGIRYIDVVSALQSHPDPESLYYELDGHTTGTGNKVIANALVSHILNTRAPHSAQ